MYHSRVLNQCLVESLAYARLMAAARIHARSCPHGGYFDDSDDRCWQCKKGTECQWLDTFTETITASGMSTDELVRALDVAVGFMADYKTHHDRQTCDCRTCSWLRDTRHLLKRARKKSAN